MSGANWWESAPLINSAGGAPIPAPTAPAPAAPAAAASQPEKDDWWKTAPLAEAAPQEVGTLRGLGMGILRGAKDVVDTGAQALASGFDRLAGTKEGDRVSAMNAAGKADFESEYGDSGAAKLGRVGGQIATTLPIGGGIGAGISRVAAAGVAPKVLTPLAESVATAGMRATGAGLGTRVAGGAITGGASAAAVDPDSAGAGAAIGAALPPALVAAKKVGQSAGALVAPFVKSGQERIAGDALRSFATNADDAVKNLRNVPDLVAGSAPTTAAAAGDVGLAGLQRTLANRGGAFNGELTERAAAQNAARTAAIENIAGNPGKIAVAEEARDAATGAMRESVLERASKIDASPILANLERMITDPSNAGLLSQRALRGVRSQIEKSTKDGIVHGRALYAIRKDVNDALSGKLQGESGNLRYASGQLVAVKGLIDDVIEQASQNVRPSKSRAMVPASNLPDHLTNPVTPKEPLAGWRQYLSRYAEMSRPIEQMKGLQDVLQRIQVGTMDTRGTLGLSAAKLNNIMKNEGAKLGKVLTSDQLQVLRNVQADMNATILGNTAGKAVGSNTIQNLAGDQLLATTLGKQVGGSALAQGVIGNLLRLPYARAGQAIEEKLGDAALNPNVAAELMEKAVKPRAINKLGQGRAAAISARTLPLLAVDQSER